jgi:hypothetical protein
MQYAQECKKIWKTQVPRIGQSAFAYGEVLRQIEALRHEAQDAENANWDADFSFFCDHIEAFFSASEHLSEAQKSQAAQAIGAVRSAGHIAQRYHAGDISDEDLCLVYNMVTAYTDDAAYDDLSDLLGFIATQEPVSPPHTRRHAVTR